MKLVSPKCPECRCPAAWVEEVATVVLGIEEQDEECSFDYDGQGAQVDYDSSRPIRDALGRVSVSCVNGHAWQSFTNYAISEAPCGEG